MIFLYTINNTDVLLLSHPHQPGFVLKQLSPPPSRQDPREHPVWTIPAHFPPPTCAAEQVSKKSFRTASGWTDHVSHPPGREVTRAMSHNCRMKNTAEACGDCQMSLGDACFRCCQVLPAGLACEELKMQRDCHLQWPTGQCAWQNDARQALNWL